MIPTLDLERGRAEALRELEAQGLEIVPPADVVARLVGLIAPAAPPETEAAA